MPYPQPSAPTNSDNGTLPIFHLDQKVVLGTPTDADSLKNLLLMLSRRPENSKYKRTLRKAADEIREKAFGYNRQTTRRKILKLLSEFHICEIDDFTEELNIPEPEIRAALAELAAEAVITVGRRRRWQEAGKHYNEIFSLASLSD